MVGTCSIHRSGGIRVDGFQSVLFWSVMTEFAITEFAIRERHGVMQDVKYTQGQWTFIPAYVEGAISTERGTRGPVAFACSNKESDIERDWHSCQSKLCSTWCEVAVPRGKTNASLHTRTFSLSPTIESNFIHLPWAAVLALLRKSSAADSLSDFFFTFTFLRHWYDH